jgi:hypothetical protein
VIEKSDIDRDTVVAEVRAVFERYEAALVANDVDVLDELFWRDPRTIRFGVGENLYGFDAIAAFRGARVLPGGSRELRNTTIVAYGPDAASAMTEFRWDTAAAWNRQSQMWVRMPEGWRVVAAHVSAMRGDGQS